MAGRTVPKLGLSAEEKAAVRRDALAWGLDTGAVRPVVEAYRRARRSGNSHLTAMNDAAAEAHALGQSNEQCQETARVLIAWAMETRAAWFEGIEG